MKQRTSNLKDYKLYTLTELEGLLGITHRTLLTHIKDKKLKASKIAGKWRITERNLKLYLKGEAKTNERK